MKLKPRKRFPLLMLMIVSLLGFSPALWSNPTLQEIEDLLSVFPEAELVTREESSASNYQLALGPVKKSRGVWRPEKEKRLAGELTRVTLRIPGGYGALEAFIFYRNRFNAREARTIFYCEKRRCGSSNSWANNIFGIKQLYGLDNDQFYGVFEITDEDGHLHYFVLYSVARGNKRVFTQIEWLQTRSKAQEGIAPDAGVIAEQLNGQGYFIVSGLSLTETNSATEPNVDIQEDFLSAITVALNKNRRLSIRIVGHDYSPQDLSLQTQRSLYLAKQFQEKLIAAGVNANRVESHGVGSLAPNPGGYSSGDVRSQFRIEIIKVQGK